MPEPDEFGCPECGGEIDSGYGLAFGNGLGTYNFCTVCDWVHKEPDPEYTEDPDDEDDQD